uniref:Uncharacterized protein n=1 Tax=Homalodisca liturata TaxID=320908 RepID=A0A1B6JWP9_9HEMI
MRACTVHLVAFLVSVFTLGRCQTLDSLFDVLETNYLGCYIDGGIDNRLMRGFQENFQQTLTPSLCKKFCFDKGFAFAGTQYSYECFCANTRPPDEKKSADDQCVSRCSGDQANVCGGPNRLSVYSTGIREKQQRRAYIGCFVDGGIGNRLLTGLQQDFPQSLTQDVCNKHCFEKGFAFAGTQYSYECFCSSSKPPEYKRAPDNQCDTKCAGDKNRICGGTNRLSVYSTGVEPTEVDTAYIGCYIDGGQENRLLQGLELNLYGTLTPEICKKTCFEKGFAFAGTQYSYECFCSRIRPPDTKKSSDAQCDSKCAGDQSKFCGGINRLSVYTTGVKETYASGLYHGCYIDGGVGNRLLRGFQQDFQQTLTQDLCSKFCYDKGFAFAGTQYSYECFCSRNKPPDHKRAPDVQCDTPCAGDRNKVCGGTDRLSVYSTGIEQTDAPDYGAEVYIGCFIDGNVGNRLMHGLQQDFPDTLTQEVCNRHCYDKGFAFAGTQYSYECFCSRTRPPTYKKAPDNQCNAKCAGDKSKTCGGSDRLSVYSTGIEQTQEPGTETVFKYVGCFKDFANGTRLMKGFHQDFPDSLTNQLCARLCRRKGFRYAGMQYGKECFCDSNKPKFQHFAKDEECSTRCDGNNNQICGGNWRISMFEIAGHVTAIDPGTYLGCYKDQESPRALKGHMEDFRNNLVPFMCTGLCYSMGFLYAGIQYSKQCFCGDEHPNPNLKVVEAECAKPCSGDATKKCGGDYRNAVYQTGIPDVPVHEKYVGCYNDFNNHIFKAHKTTLDKTNTPRRCLNYCWQLGFKYSGVEYGRECLCGDDKPDSSFLVSGDECSITCSGDQLETCGGNWRLAVYSTDISASVEPLEIDQRMPTDSTTVRTCHLSKTTINGRKVCSGDVIFEEQFSSPLGEKWKHTIKISEAPDYEFAVFQANPKNSFVSQNKLVIKPTILDDLHVLTGSLDLEGCTGTPGTRECGFQAFSYNILPPVASARINTRNSFSFRYGIVEVKAKLPVGDWLVPELWLEPKNHPYGPNYASGRIRLAMCRGNKNLQCNGQDFGSNHLESGVVMGPANDVRSRSISSTVPDNWHDYFHTYTLYWTPDSISFKTDNELPQEIVSSGGRLCEIIGFSSNTCTLWGSGSNIAPFDTDFYLSLGLSSGNARDFPDDCVNRDQTKPWKNLQVKALLNFWQDKANWSSTWNDEKSTLTVEYIRVTAL